MATNALSQSTSPYLLQHQHNPVDWLPWGEEAWARAREEGKLVIVSVGYSACHWCHVMERETFEDAEAAEFMNAHFVCIKVDREERPDVDQVYMDAVQLMTKRGGWPLNCVAMPDGRPVWGGTYFPRLKWLSSLEAVLEVWREEPAKVEAYASQLASAVAALDESGVNAVPDEDLFAGENAGAELRDERIQRKVIDGVENWSRGWDPVYGGSSGAPKFPLPCQIDFLLRACDANGWAQAWKTKMKEHALRTLRAMERGGIHDHVGGGFARYSVDERWHVPHFEKMLYDNGQLLGTLAEAWALEPHPSLERAAEGVVGFLDRELSDASGGFRSALDADSDGAEGTYYVWTEADLIAALGSGDQAEEVMRAFDVGGRSHWEDEKNVLMRQADGEEVLWGDAGLRGRLEDALQRMSAWRDSAASGRSKPGVDDKVLTAWTALAVSGLARAGKILGREDWVARAERGAVFLRNVARVPGEPELLRRSWHAKGGPETEGFAEDYALAVEAMLEVHQATGEPEWRAEARALMATALDRFYDESLGTFWFSAREAEALFARKQSNDDSVLPSANATFAASLWRLGWACDIPSWRSLARDLITRHLLGSQHLERSTKWAQVWLDVRGPFATVVVAAPSKELGKKALQEWNLGARRTGTWVDVVTPDATHIPTWMESKRPSNEAPVRWYVCVDGACGLPCANAQEAWKQFQSEEKP
ncbi:MAG: thioredoxin domain-containing protein [Flavobacteriales bacterium]